MATMLLWCFNVQSVKSLMLILSYLFIESIGLLYNLTQCLIIFTTLVYIFQPYLFLGSRILYQLFYLLNMYKINLFLVNEKLGTFLIFTHLHLLLEVYWYALDTQCRSCCILNTIYNALLHCIRCWGKSVFCSHWKIVWLECQCVTFNHLWVSQEVFGSPPH